MQSCQFAGDVIVAFDGQPINSNGDLVNAVDEKSIGDQIRLSVRRDNSKFLDFQISLQDEST